jgi:hypothetical protein
MSINNLILKPVLLIILSEYFKNKNADRMRRGHFVAFLQSNPGGTSHQCDTRGFIIDVAESKRKPPSTPAISRPEKKIQCIARLWYGC